MALEINPDSGTIQNEGGGGITLDPGASDLVTVSNGMLFPDGTVGEPGIRFDDDTNTGMYSPVNDTIAMAGQGADIMRLTGVTSAVNYLNVTPAITAGDVLIDAAGSDANISLSLNGKGTGTVKIDGLSYPTADGTANQVIETDGAGNLSFVTLPAAGIADITGESIKDLSDVFTTMTPADGEVLTYDTTNGWQSEAAAGGGNNWLTANNGSDYPTPPISTSTFYSLAMGNNTNINDSHRAVAIGNDWQASGTRSDSVWIGESDGTLQTQSSSILIGKTPKATGTSKSGSICIGTSATSTNNNGLVLGNNSSNAGDKGIAIGYNADVTSTNANSIAIGSETKCSGTRSVALGQSITVTANDEIRIGPFASSYILHNNNGNLSTTGSAAQIVLPSYATASEPTATTGGVIYDSTTNKLKFYNGTSWETPGGIADITGESIKDLSDVYSIMTPTDGQVLTYDTTNGWQAEAAAGGSIYFANTYNGTGAAATFSDSLAIGEYAVAANDFAIAIGSGYNATTGACRANGARGVAIAYGAQANGGSSVAIGREAVGGGLYATSVGTFSRAKGTNAVAIGFSSGHISTAYNNAVSIGPSVPSSAADQMRIGTSATEFVQYQASKMELTGTNAQYVLPSYTVATVPAGAVAGSMIYVTDGNAGAASGAIYDGTNWKVVALGATISAT